MQHLLLLALLVFAQALHAVVPGDGPGGVGKSDGTSELELWLKADALSLANGVPVSAWTDSSGNGRTLSQPNASFQPIFVTGALGGLPVVRFTGDYLSSVDLPSNNNELTLVAVIKPTQIGAYHNVIDGAGGNRPMLWIDVTGNYEFNFNTGAVAGLSGGTDLLFAVKRNSGPQYSQLYRNGPMVTAGGPNAFNIPVSQTYSFFNRAGAQAFQGDVAELIVYSTALTEAEIGKVGYHLQQKYGLTSTFPPTTPVFSGYSTNPAIYGVNQAIVANTPLLAGGTPTGFSIAPSLPAGLALNPTTGVITGTPTAASMAADYTVTATFAGSPSVSTQISITVTQPAIIGYSRNPAVFTRTRTVQPVEPVLRGAPFAEFSVSPALPAGLQLHPQTGVISGMPTTSAGPENYTIRATSPGYPNSQTTLSVEVLEISATLDISEFMASNGSTVADGDGAYSDWIEIHNYGSVAIDLDGWSLTDSGGNLRKWVFPPRILPAGGYLLVFASGDSHVDSAGNLHADFKLEASGEYLALVRPDGTTIARQFSPAFPAQSEDQSYGTRDRITYGTYNLPTPGAANGFLSAITASVTASPTGRNFTGTLSVTLSAPLSGSQVIRYTLNGNAPTASSPIYSNPLNISTNTRLRARVFRTRMDPGPEMMEIYLKLGADLQTFSSNLPLVFLNPDGAIAAANSPTLTGTSTVFVPLESASGRAAASGAPEFNGRSGLRLRGRSSASFPQKQFKFSTWDDRDKESDRALLGLPERSDWVLHAPWSDKSLVRNALAYSTWSDLGWPSLNFRFVEVFLNENGDGQFTYAGDYVGVYMLVEGIKLESIGLNDPQSTSNYPEITGGFINETGNADSQEYSTTASGRSVAHAYADPNSSSLNTTQKTWLRDRVTAFEQALYGGGFTHPTTGLHYSAYTDVDSQVDYKIAREWSRNFDGGSTFSHIPRGGKLTMGPLWDYNWAFGNVNYAEGGDSAGYVTTGWNRSFTSAVNGWAPWWLRFEQDPDWWQAFIDRWTTLREGVLSNAEMNARIDALTGPLAQEAVARNFTRWPQLGVFTVISAPGYETRTTYQSEVDYLKTWLQNRSAWMDSQFPKRPSFSAAPGPVTPGTPVTISAEAGQTIYYTTDGSDPRLPGGTIRGSAISIGSGASVTINSSTILNARVKNGAAWGAPRVSAYVTGLPATPQNIVITEIAYHAADPTSAELASDPTLGDNDFEFIEIRNFGAGAVDLTGAAFVEGISFIFQPGAVLAPGGHFVIAENATAFALRYGFTPGGQYTGDLSNNGETLILVAASGVEIARVTYSEAWTPAADGDGYTLTLRNPGAPPTSYSAPSAWALSAGNGGSPGQANGAVLREEFTLWQQSTFTAADLDDPLRSGALADPDQDGVVNLLEFAMASSPLSSASRPTMSTQIDGNNVVLSYTRVRYALDITDTVISSSDLVNWANPNVALEVIPQSETTELVRASIPRGAGSSMFLRVLVSGGN